jgi:two-component sensor histidine kinase
VVSDNGVGLPSDLDLDKAESLGLRLVRMLAQQLGADMRLNRGKGTEFKFIFTDVSGRERNSASASLSREPVGAKAGGA